jgi:PAS domain S-box-containing protein
MNYVDVLLLTSCGGALLVNLMTVNQRRLTADLALEHEALKATEGRLRVVVHEMPVLMDAYDERGNIVAWNKECERVTGYTAAEIVANPRAMELLYPDAEYRSLMVEEAVRRRDESYSTVWDLVAKDGSVKTIEWFNVGARLKIPGWLEWSIGIDITERRHLEDSLRDATLHEQRRLSRELHDSLGQELTGLSMLASGLARSRAGSDLALAADLAQLALIASQAIVTCKNIARGLAPITDPDDGLAEALRGLVEALAAQNRGVDLKYEVNASSPLLVPLESSNHLYRIAQEALNNALKHGARQCVRVKLEVDTGRVRIEVSDDGRGMVAAMGTDVGLGLRSMRDRATAIGAVLSMVPSEWGGTTVRCECPNSDPEPQRR